MMFKVRDFREAGIVWASHRRVAAIFDKRAVTAPFWADAS